VGALDPDLRHHGAGVERLREAGLELVLLEGDWRLAKTSPHFLSWTGHERLRRPRPWTIAKWAQTRTGQLSPPPNFGDGRWISGPDSRAEVQLLRGRVGAIVTGVKNTLAEVSIHDPLAVFIRPVRIEKDCDAPCRSPRVIPKGMGEE
jgi:diaminohydroxyphosphoribosylaminopyrimidine deaminase/5-amino-6-(5-phosphoribosylamino)uracil reductase